MALDQKQLAVRVKELKSNLQQAQQILDDLVLDGDSIQQLKTIGNMADQAAKEAFMLVGIMYEKN